MAGHVEESERRLKEIEKLKLARRGKSQRSVTSKHAKPLPSPPPPLADGADAPDGEPVIGLDRVEEIAGFVQDILKLPRVDAAGGSLSGALLTLARDPRQADMAGTHSLFTRYAYVYLD